jgi:hypothetical protein
MGNMQIARAEILRINERAGYFMYNYMAGAQYTQYKYA